MPDPKDAYGRISYRALIDWGPRIEREAPFLRQCLNTAPSRSLLDLGCGTGEHAAFLAAEGWDVLGVDPSEEQIAAARQHETPDRSLRFVCGAMHELPALTEDSFGGAICLGNVLPSLDDERLEPSLRALAARLQEGAPLLVQLLNTARLRETPVRHLPLNFRPDPGREGDEIVFLRLLRPEGERHLSFRAITLEVPRDADAPSRIREATQVRWRAWTADELRGALEATGFRDVAFHGDMKGGPFDAESSHDLVLLAHRGAPAPREDA